MPYGICMEGNEPAFERAMHAAVAAFPDEAIIRIVEVGTAAGGSTRGMAEFFRATRKPFALHTFDIPDGWSYHAEQVVAIEDEFVEVAAHAFTGGMRGWVTAMNWQETVHFAFIDGCHGAPCAKADFETLEALAVPGTHIVFHDTNDGCQGVHLQPHCQTGIAVRQALRDLGLLDNTRPGWQLVEETNSAHGITVVRRV